MSEPKTPLQLVQSARLVVVKVGTGVLSGPAGSGIDRRRIEQLAEDLALLHKRGKQVILVSSGAIGAGMGILGWTQRPRELARSQAAAAVGQGHLMQSYTTAFSRHGINVAQVLLTREDLINRRRYLNARQTMRALLKEGVLPVVNENDTVSVEEIRFGDNDELSALVAQLMDAELLVILTDVDGFEMREIHGHREPVPLVERITPEMERSAGGTSRETSSGGMISKLHAARIVMASGIGMLLANGAKPGILKTLLLDGHLTGTFFLPSRKGRLGGRKRWLAFTAKPRGQVRVDAGAKRALVSEGRSLLASGVRTVLGPFLRGDLVSVRDEEGREFARGLINYPDAELDRIRGMRSEAIATLLGRRAEEVVHRDSMVILE